MNRVFEQRGERRYSFFKPVEISWTDGNGDQRHAKGMSIDVSLYGAMVEISEAVPLYTEVSVRIDGKEISSKPRVLHCREASSWFRVGLKFNRTLLAEQLPILDSVLIYSLRCARKGAEASNMSRVNWWPGIVRRVHALFAWSRLRRISAGGASTLVTRVRLLGQSTSKERI